jgi:hypothetical protein
MWPIPPQFRVIFLAAVAAFVCAVGFWLGWKLNGINVRTAQVALSDQQAQYRTLQAQGQTEALQRLKDSVAKAKEIDNAHQTEIAKILADAAARPPRIIRVQCNTAPVPAGGGGQASDTGELAGESALGWGVGPAFRDVDLAQLDAIRDEAKIVSSRLRGLQAVCLSSE